MFRVFVFVKKRGSPSNDVKDFENLENSFSDNFAYTRFHIQPGEMGNIFNHEVPFTPEAYLNQFENYEWVECPFLPIMFNGEDGNLELYAPSNDWQAKIIKIEQWDRIAKSKQSTDVDGNPITITTNQICKIALDRYYSLDTCDILAGQNNDGSCYKYSFHYVFWWSLWWIMFQCMNDLNPKVKFLLRECERRTERGVKAEINEDYFADLDTWATAHQDLYPPDEIPNLVSYVRSLFWTYLHNTSKLVKDNGMIYSSMYDWLTTKLRYSPDFPIEINLYEHMISVETVDLKNDFEIKDKIVVNMGLSANVDFVNHQYLWFPFDKRSTSYVYSDWNESFDNATIAKLNDITLQQSEHPIMCMSNRLNTEVSDVYINGEGEEKKWAVKVEDVTDSKFNGVSYSSYRSDSLNNGNLFNDSVYVNPISGTSSYIVLNASAISNLVNDSALDATKLVDITDSTSGSYWECNSNSSSGGTDVVLNGYDFKKLGSWGSTKTGDMLGIGVYIGKSNPNADGSMNKNSNNQWELFIVTTILNRDAADDTKFVFGLNTVSNFKIIHQDRFNGTEDYIEITGKDIQWYNNNGELKDKCKFQRFNNATSSLTGVSWWLVDTEDKDFVNVRWDQMNSTIPKHNRYISRLTLSDTFVEPGPIYNPDIKVDNRFLKYIYVGTINTIDNKNITSLMGYNTNSFSGSMLELSGSMGVYLLPITNDYLQYIGYYGNQTSQVQVYSTNIISYLISHLALQTVANKGSTPLLQVPATWGNIAAGIVGIWVSEKSPLVLARLVGNNTTQNLANKITYLDINESNSTINWVENWVTLWFLTQVFDDSTPDKPAWIKSGIQISSIYVDSNSFYEILERNDQEDEWTLEFFDKLNTFVEGDFTKWDETTEPSLISPTALQLRYINSTTSDGSLALTADMFNLANFNTTIWSFGMSTNITSSSFIYKFNLNKLKSKYYLWTELEDALVVVDQRVMNYEVSGSAQSLKETQMITNTGNNIGQQQWDFTGKWNAIENKLGVASAVVGGIGGTLSSVASGVATGGKMGGGPGAIAGGVTGLISGAASAVMGGIAKHYEIKNRNEGFAMEKRIDSLRQQTDVLNNYNKASDRILTKSLATALMKNSNDNVINASINSIALKTAYIPKWQNISVVERARLYGRPWQFWGEFRSWDQFTVCNYLALDNEENSWGKLIFSLQKTMEEKIQDDYKFADLFSDTAIKLFFQRLCAGMRLWDDLEMDITKKHEHWIDDRINEEGGEKSLCPQDPLKKGHERYINSDSKFNISPHLEKSWWRKLNGELEITGITFSLPNMGLKYIVYGIYFILPNLLI